MEQTISKFPNPFGSVAPHKLFAWGLLATVGYGFAIWGVRIYQNQTVELGGQLLVVLMQAFVLPALLYGADRLRRRFPADATALFGGLLFAQIPRLAASAGSAWLYAWLLPLGNGSVSPLQETMQAGGLLRSVENGPCPVGIRVRFPADVRIRYESCHKYIHIFVSLNRYFLFG